MKATREKAFLQALSAAGITHSVTRACSAGKLGSCGCDGSILVEGNEVRRTTFSIRFLLKSLFFFFWLFGNIRCILVFGNEKFLESNCT